VSRLRDFPGRDAFIVAHIGMLWWLVMAALELTAPSATICARLFGF